MHKQNPISWLADLGGVLAAVVMIAVTMHILLEIFLRAFFQTSTFVLDEFVGYGIATLSFFSMAYALNHDALIRVEFLHNTLPRGARMLAEIFSITVTFVIFSGLAWYIFILIKRNFMRGVVSESVARVPLWIPQSLVLLGLLVFLLALIRRAVLVLRDANEHESGSGTL